MLTYNQLLPQNAGHFVPCLMHIPGDLLACSVGDAAGGDCRHDDPVNLFFGHPNSPSLECEQPSVATAEGGVLASSSRRKVAA